MTELLNTTYIPFRKYFLRHFYRSYFDQIHNVGIYAVLRLAHLPFLHYYSWQTLLGTAL